jgi:PAS domain S-box-containing protein
MLKRRFQLIAIAAELGIFGVGLFLSPGFSVNSLYAIPILLSIWAPHPQGAITLAALSTLLILVSSFIVPAPPVSIAALAFSRTFVAVALWMTAFVVIRYRRSEEMRQTDVLARREAERASRRSAKDLEDVKYALDQSAIVATTDVHGVITYVNERFSEISKYTANELIGQRHDIIDSGLHSQEFFAAMGRTVSAGQVWRGEVQSRAKDGSLYWQDVTIVPFLDDQRQPYQFVVIGYDITERKQTEAALRDREALARLGQMAAIVAHEVRNPLAGIRGAVQVIGKRLPPGQDHAVVSEVVARIDTLNRIVADLLLFARPNQPVFARVPVAAVIEHTVSLFQQDPLVSSIALDVVPTDAVVRADAEQIKLVLLNLLINGAQAMQGRGRLSVTTAGRNGSAEIRIRDEGPGIPPDVREHLFEPFFTAKHQGTGLGLAIARRIVDAHNGSLALECPPEGGTVAVLKLPTA